MKSATVRDLRNRLALVSAWIEEGESVEITKGGRAFARLIPAPAARRRAGKPDILARLKKTWGSRVFSQQEAAAMRAAELEGEAG